MAARVTVIIPTYNDAATLAETVRSALGQDEPVEIVVVDDGSDEPASLSLLDELRREPRLRVLRQDHNGPASARTLGAQTATTPYLFPLDADDLLLPGALKQLADALDAHPLAAVAYGDFRTFGQRSGLHRTLPYVCPWLLTYRNTLPGGSLIRREAWQQTAGWQDSHAQEDWGLWLSLIERGWQGVKVDQEIFLYRIRPGSRFSQNRENLDSDLAELAHDHRRLFAERERNRRNSPTPWLVRTLLPSIRRLPLPIQRRLLLEGLLIGVSERLRGRFRQRTASARSSRS